ncbi:KAP family P-loop NTPase fold protein [Chitinophaga caseinilytica]|uniref:P-loop NTPase fold protein n=1 Tax=Chitinophaga caseinilytica TaxID=2267521 RepID=A0ABZ2Z1V2_9BACT
MILKHKDIEIPPDNPFKNCKLKRKPYAETLTNLVSNYADGFVLSVNTPWGTGKTTFIKMWQVYLQQQRFETIYFNAWENDFDSDPMVALMSELKTLVKKETEDNFDKLIKKAAIVCQNILPALIKTTAEKYLGEGVITDLAENTTKAATEILKDEIADYAKKKKGLADFRRELAEYITEYTNGKPLVIFIDEMDRCRPNYAVELLEKVKHFFSVPGIVFVLAIDKEQLGNAIKGCYGSENFNSNEYLRRFIDLEFKLPIPSVGLYSEYLFEYFRFDEFFGKASRQHQEFKKDMDNFKFIAKFLFNHLGLNLRHQEKVFAQARVVLSTFKSNEYLFPLVYLFLVYAKDCKPSFYQRLTDGTTSPQGILDLLAEILPSELQEEEEMAFELLEVHLIVLYTNHYKETVRKYPELIDDTGKLLIKPSTDRSEEYISFTSLIKQMKQRTSNMSNVSITHLLKKIDLLDNFQME